MRGGGARKMAKKISSRWRRKRYRLMSLRESGTNNRLKERLFVFEQMQLHETSPCKRSRTPLVEFSPDLTFHLLSPFSNCRPTAFGRRRDPFPVRHNRRQRQNHRCTVSRSKSGRATTGAVTARPCPVPSASAYLFLRPLFSDPNLLAAPRKTVLKRTWSAECIKTGTSANRIQHHKGTIPCNRPFGFTSHPEIQKRPCSGQQNVLRFTCACQSHGYERVFHHHNITKQNFHEFFINL